MKKLRGPLRGLIAVGLASALVLSAGVVGASAAPDDPPVTEQTTAPITPETPSAAAATVEDFATACASNVTASGTFGTAPWCVTSDLVLHFGAGVLDSLGFGAETPWEDQKPSITQVIFHGTVEEPTYGGDSTWGLFAMPELTTIKNTVGFDTRNVTDMTLMFMGASSLASLDALSWDTSNVTTMRQMFDSASSLDTLNISTWNTSSVTDMGYMFKGLSLLEELNIADWNTGNVKDMDSMFWDMPSLTKLDVSNWDTGSVDSTSNMFFNARSLTNLDVAEWDTSAVRDMSGMFTFTTSLTGLDLSSWNTSKLENTSGMFYGAESLTGLDLSNWDTSKVTEMFGMFQRAYSLATLNMSGWNTGSATNISQMFYSAEALTSLDLSSWNTSNVAEMHGMFPPNLKRLKLGNASSFNETSIFGASEVIWDQIGTDGMPLTNANGALLFSGNFAALLTRSQIPGISAGTYAARTHSVGTLKFTTNTGTGNAFSWSRPLLGEITLPTSSEVRSRGWSNPGYVFVGWKLYNSGSALSKYRFPSTAIAGSTASFTAVWKREPASPPPNNNANIPATNTSPVFLDTPLNHKFYKEIDWMFNMKYTTGIKTSAGLSYEPKSSLTREAMAAFIYRLQAPQNYKTPKESPFADVKPGDKFYTEITWMHKAGLSTGTRQVTGKPLFAPKDGLSREAMAAFIYRLEAPEKYKAPAVSKFADMKKGDKFYTEVSWMYSVKLSTGNKVGSTKEYWPKSTLSREAMAAFIYRLVNTYRPSK